MSKFLLPTLIVSLALWLLLGSFWLDNQTTNKVKPTDTKEVNMFIVEHESFKAVSPTIFAFIPSEIDVIINDEQLAVLDSLASYLNRSPQKQLLLNAFYEKGEKKKEPFSNIGEARAHSIKNILVRKGAPEDQVKVEGKFVENLNLNENGLISGGVEFDIFDREAFSLTEKRIFFFFEEGQFSVKETDEIENSVAQLKQLLVDFPESKLRIYGTYTGKGMPTPEARKRAEAVKAYFLKKGFNQDRFGPVLFENHERDSFAGHPEEEKMLNHVFALVY